MNKYEEIKKKVDDMAEDADKFYNRGNKVAGRRLRACAQEVKVLTKELRDDVTALKNT